MSISVLLVALLSAVAGLRWRSFPVVAAIAVWIAIPFAAVTQLGLTVVGLHPGAAIIGCSFVAALLFRTRDVLRDTADALPLVLAISVFIGTALITTWTFAPEGLGMVINTIVVPALAFGAVRNVLRESTAVSIVRRSVLVIAALEALVSIAVRFGVVTQPWQSQLSESYHWFGADFDRAVGTTDHALVLVMVFTIATPMLVSTSSALLRLSTGALFVLATSLTESRSGLVVVTLMYVVVVLRGRSSAWTRMFVGLASLGVLGFLATTSVAAAVLGKFADDGGSANARTIGLEWALQNLDRFAVIGSGSGSSFRITSSLWTSLENPFLMYLVDFGLPATVLLAAVIVSIVLWRPCVGRPIAGGVLVGLGTVVHAVTFSSIATFSSAGPLFWVALGFSALPLGVHRQAHSEPRLEPVLASEGVRA